ncbi:hypothetical protein C3L33_02203, partial [Rhododendron williamsianum]
SISTTNPFVNPMANWLGWYGCAATTLGYTSWPLQHIAREGSVRDRLPRVSEGKRRRLSYALPRPPTTANTPSRRRSVHAIDLPASPVAFHEDFDLSSSDPLLPQDLCQSAADLSSHSSVPYKPLLRLLSGSDFIFTCPKPREKSEELKARLRKLEELAERKEYEELVKDITQSKGTDEPFSSYKDQLGFAISSALFDYGRELWCQISLVGLIYRSCFSFSLS